jgi:hypothetical protein
MYIYMYPINQVSPFDIVEEFNRSVEQWVHNVHDPPGAAMINATILQVHLTYIDKCIYL